MNLNYIKPLSSSQLRAKIGFVPTLSGAIKLSSPMPPLERLYITQNGTQAHELAVFVMNQIRPKHPVITSLVSRQISALMVLQVLAYGFEIQTTPLITRKIFTVLSRMNCPAEFLPVVVPATEPRPLTCLLHFRSALLESLRRYVRAITTN